MVTGRTTVAGAPGHTAADGNLNPDFAALAREQLTKALAGTTLEAMLVAVHPWDTEGARRAGLTAV
jgi:hypothetical protein